MNYGILDTTLLGKCGRKNRYISESLASPTHSNCIRCRKPQNKRINGIEVLIHLGAFLNVSWGNLILTLQIQSSLVPPYTWQGTSSRQNAPIRPTKMEKWYWIRINNSSQIIIRNWKTFVSYLRSILILIKLAECEVIIGKI